jgi:spore coat protein SA
MTVFSRPSGVIEENGIRYVGIEWTWLEQQCAWIKAKLSWRNPLRYLVKIQNVFSYASRIKHLLTHFDYVIVHNEPNVLLFLNRVSKQKIWLHMHNDHLVHPVFRHLYRHALKKVDRVICVSEYIKRTAIKVYPEYGNKFHVIYNATDVTLFKPYGEKARMALNSTLTVDPDCRYLLYVGRLTEVKGVHILIEAFQQVLKAFPQTRLVITGSSFFGDAAVTTYQKKLIELATPVANAIIFTGFIPHTQLKYLYSIADIVVVPSVWQDPCPLVVLEAMASETCVVATAVGGIPEVIEHDANGILIAPDDVIGMSEAICSLLNQPSHMANIATQARQTMVNGYDWSRLVKALEQSINP